MQIATTESEDTGTLRARRAARAVLIWKTIVVDEFFPYILERAESGVAARVLQEDFGPSNIVISCEELQKTFDDRRGSDGYTKFLTSDRGLSERARIGHLNDGTVDLVGTLGDVALLDRTDEQEERIMADLWPVFLYT